MRITIEALEAAFAPIEEVGKGEVTFPINGVDITMRRILPEEEAEVHRYAVAFAKTSDDNSGNGMEYIERFKLGVLSHSVVCVGATNLRDVEYVETGEVLGNGNAVKIRKVEALRKTFSKWSTTVRVAMFRKYSNLISEIEQKAEKVIQFDPTDVDSEIERLEERLDRLKELREQNKLSLESEVSKIIKSISSDGEPEQPVPVAARPPQPEPVTPPVRQSAVPVAVKPAQPQPQPQPRVQTARVVPDPADYAAGMDEQDSFINPGDHESMDEMVHAENMRMYKQRTAAGTTNDDGPPSVLTQIHSQRRPPHLSDRDDESDELSHLKRRVDGVDAYRVTQPEQLVGMTVQPPPVGKAVPKGVNTKFQPPKRF